MSVPGLLALESDGASWQRALDRIDVGDATSTSGRMALAALRDPLGLLVLRSTSSAGIRTVRVVVGELYAAGLEEVEDSTRVHGMSVSVAPAYLAARAGVGPRKYQRRRSVVVPDMSLDDVTAPGGDFDRRQHAWSERLEPPLGGERTPAVEVHVVQAYLPVDGGLAPVHGRSWATSPGGSATLRDDAAGLHVEVCSSADVLLDLVQLVRPPAPA